MLGTVGATGIVAPVPADDSIDSPIILKAITLARIKVPVVILKGEARNTLAGIEHVLLEITDELFTPSQYVVSSYHVFEDVSTYIR